MRSFRIRPLPALLGYPILGLTAGCLIWFGTATVVGWYYVAFFPVPLLAAALGVAAAREWKRSAQRAFVGACLGVMAASVALIPVGPNPGMLLPAMCAGVAIGVGLGLRIRQ